MNDDSAGHVAAPGGPRRRYLTIVFSDLSDSTRLMLVLDPWDLLVFRELCLLPTPPRSVTVGRGSTLHKQTVAGQLAHGEWRAHEAAALP